MYTNTILTIAALLATTKVSAHNSTYKCAPGLKMFVSRGTNESISESMGLGTMARLVEAIGDQINGSDIEAILYPAASDPEGSYFESVGNGTRLVKNSAIEYADACPGSKMAFFGYSQGAQITSNNFCGMPAVWAIFAGFDSNDISGALAFTQPVPTNVTKDVVSVVLFGDTTHRHDATYRRGNGTGNGIFWRANITTCEALGSRIRSYCDFGDPFCSVSNEVTGAHLTYVENYGTEVAQFVVEQYKNSETQSDGTLNSTVSTPKPTNTPIQNNGPRSSSAVVNVAITTAHLGLGMM